MAAFKQVSMEGKCSRSFFFGGISSALITGKQSYEK